MYFVCHLPHVVINYSYVKVGGTGGLGALAPSIRISELGGGWKQTRPRSLYPQERDPLSIVQEVVWSRGPVWRVRKISPSSAFDPRPSIP
jgi:hypothetical protein